MKNKSIQYWILTLMLALSPTLANAATVDLPGYVSAEDYERYYDTTEGNSGQQYRTDHVDIRSTNDAGGGYTVGWTASDEWLEYDINITQAGVYTAEVRVASNPGNGQFSIEIDGDTKGDLTTVSSTGGWENWDSVFVNLGTLSQGNHSFRFKIQKGGFDVNWINFIKEESIDNGTVFELPGYVSAEDYQRYYDTTTGNMGEEYRSDDVDIGVTNDTGGGYSIGWTAQNEWLEYDIHINQAGTYTAEVRVASNSEYGQFNLQIDGTTQGNSTTVSSTGGWDNWDSVFVNLGYLSQGSHTFRMYIENGGFNINWINFITDESVVNATAPLEPADGKVIYGIGQDGITLGAESTDTTNGELRQIHDGIWNINNETGVYPMLRHFYATKHDGGESSFQGRLSRLTEYNRDYNHDYIGMFSFKFAEQQDVWDLLNGELDDEIRAIGRAAAENGRPMFFRPFYEFNEWGDSSAIWSGMAGNGGKTGEQWFIDAWTVFRSLVRQGVDEVNGDNDQIAFVWCLLGSNPSDFISFYPGDDQVDWVGIDIFSVSHLENAKGPILTWVKNNTDRGDGRSKPIILPEVQPSLPQGATGDVSTQGKQNSVDQFFSPLFDFMENNDEVKGLVYMNFWFNKLFTDGNNDWVEDVGLVDWKDGRIQPTAEADWDATVFYFFTNKIGNSNIYLSEGQNSQLD